MIVRIGLVAAVAFPAAAFATNGYFSHGVGMKAKGMGGAGIAVSQDALGAGSNPGAVAFTGDRVDVGIDYFRPMRESEVVGNAYGVDGVYEANDTKDFYVPEFGVTKGLNDRFSVALLLYGRGGMNTDYADPFPLFGTSEPGVDLAQLYVVPAVAVKLHDDHALGVGINFAYQRFEATGLENFTAKDPQAISLHPDKITNNDYATSTGFGVHVGWMGRIAPGVALGASYQSKVTASEFDEYAGLFAEEGDFDIPASYGAGFAVDLGPKVLIAADVMQILYSEVNAVANPLLPNLGMAPLGDAEGAGFGWEDVTAYKVGLAVDAIPSLTLRGGYNYGAQPIPASETFFNILAPGVVEQHATVGATWKMPVGGELTLAYMHAFEKTVEGENSIPGGTAKQSSMGGGEANLTMSEDSFGIAFGRVF